MDEIYRDRDEKQMTEGRGMKRQVTITREGLAEMKPYAVSEENPEGDSGDGLVLEILLREGRFNDGSGLIWEALEDYETAAQAGQATKYDAHYLEEPGTPGYVCIRRPDYVLNGEGEAYYDLVVERGRHEAERA